jgi:hypothetical protein
MPRQPNTQSVQLKNTAAAPTGSMKTASRLPTNPRFSTAIPTIGPIPRKGDRRLCRHNRRPIRHVGRTMAAMALGDTYKEGMRFVQAHTAPLLRKHV